MSSKNPLSKQEIDKFKKETKPKGQKRVKKLLNLGCKALIISMGELKKSFMNMLKNKEKQDSNKKLLDIEEKLQK